MARTDPPHLPPRFLTTVRTLRVDAVTAEVLRAFEDEGVPSILLKGPAIARSLYSDGGMRTYSDSDLLVEPTAYARSSAVLEELGFSLLLSERDLAEPWHADTWLRSPDGAVVDLHRTLWGTRVSGRTVWSVLQGQTTTLTMGGVPAQVLTEPGIALHVALHAAAHGVRSEKPITDLSRALERFSPDVWRVSAILADQLEAAGAFTTGLSLHPAGREIVRVLGLPAPTSVEASLLAGSAPPLAAGMARIAGMTGARTKASLVARKVVPAPRFMRMWSSVARRGRFGLAIAYAWRPLWLLLHLLPASRAWARATKRRRD